MATNFARAEDVLHLSPLSEEEKPHFFERMRHTVVVTLRVPIKKRKRGDRGGGGRSRGAGRDGDIAVGAETVAIRDEAVGDDIHYGSGFVIDGEGHILTWLDNVKGSGSSVIQVQFFGDNKPRDASVVFKDSKRNLIILKPKEFPAPVHYTEFAGNEGEDGNVHLGMQVYCIGHPLRLAYNMLIGQVCFPCDAVAGQCRQFKDIVTAKRVSSDETKLKELDGELTLIQLNNIHGSCAADDATDGAPVFDANGRVLGMLAFDCFCFDFAIHYKELRACVVDFKQKSSVL